MKKKIGILIAAVMAISLCLVPGVALAADPYDEELVLENKDASWDVIPNDDIQGLLEYNNSGAEFEYRLTVSGLKDDVDYSIIYYADKPNRFVDWGGDNPGALIGTFTYDATPKVTSGSAELNMNLPTEPDANISEYDYTAEYGTAHGAKIWVVPSVDWTAGSPDKLTAWNPDRYLFETGLITYNDTDLASLSLNADIEQITAITVGPVFIHFGNLALGASSSTEVILVENVGTVAVSVGALLDPLTGTVFNELKLNGAYSPSSKSGNWPTVPGLGNLLPSIIGTVNAQLVIPATYSAQGTEYATLVFIATPPASP